ncbi:glycosyltransferase [Chryseobacterium sp. H3056]|uniref:Glycosyltransferase n=1 Tax=Kaistella daneshvariae TaxID=2487074 RepID=A0A3N0WVX5_9FLAO|nr:glycosyltransferase [Kaistella daneshvariae]ROI09236.1 glycosyltransferase [Kaistella daneshvariae]
MEQPLVSILCGCYNQSKFIPESLDSIKNQTFRNYEVIIWDDASGDNSVEIIEKWISENPEQPVTFIKHQINVGICKSLNECFVLSKGKYIQMLALDDILLPHKLERHVEILEHSKPTDALVFSDAYVIDDEGNCYQNRFIARYKNYLSLESGNYWNDLIQGNFIPAMSVLLKREVLTEVGVWDENLPYEDYDMWLRISSKYNFIFDDVISVCYRLHSANTHLIKGIDGEIWFDMFVKHIDDATVKKNVHNYIITKYLKNEYPKNTQKYYNRYPAKSVLDKIIFYRLPTLVYRIINKISN